MGHPQTVCFGEASPPAGGTPSLRGNGSPPQPFGRWLSALFRAQRVRESSKELGRDVLLDEAAQPGTLSSWRNSNGQENAQEGKETFGREDSAQDWRRQRGVLDRSSCALSRAIPRRGWPFFCGADVLAEKVRTPPLQTKGWGTRQTPRVSATHGAPGKERRLLMILNIARVS